MPSKDDAKAALLLTLIALRRVMAEAESIGTAHLGVFAMNEQGGGRILAGVRLEELLDNLAALLDAPPPDGADLVAFRQLQILSHFDVEGCRPN